MDSKPLTRPSLKALADKCGVSVVSLRAWKKGGCDVFNPSALAERISQMKGGASSEPMKRERLRKLRADASLAEHELAKRRGEVITADAVENLFNGLTIACVAQFKRAPAELPGELEGMTSAAMKQRLLNFRDEQIAAVLSLMEGVFSQLEASHPHQ